MRMITDSSDVSSRLLARMVFVLGVLYLLFVSAAHAGQATLSWEAPTTNIDGTPLIDLAGYVIYYGETSLNYTSWIYIGTQTTYVLTGLTEGQIYYFAVTAYDVAGNESFFSEEVSLTIPFSSAEGTPIFADGFEWGDTSAWSVTVP